MHKRVELFIHMAKENFFESNYVKDDMDWYFACDLPPQMRLEVLDENERLRACSYSSTAFQYIYLNTLLILGQLGSVVAALKQTYFNPGLVAVGILNAVILAVAMGFQTKFLSITVVAKKLFTKVIEETSKSKKKIRKMDCNYIKL